MPTPSAICWTGRSPRAVEIALGALADGLGVGSERTVRRDLSDIAGTWRKDAEVDAALASHDRVDSRLWK